jgi:hypothetical protein
MLIHSMSVSVDGFTADRQRGFRWTVPSQEQFRYYSTGVLVDRRHATDMTVLTRGECRGR